MAKGNFRGFQGGGGFGGGNMNNMIRQAQKMQEDMLKMQEELKEKTFEASSGGGAVTVKITGKKVLSEIKINPDVVDKDDVEMLEDLILVAVNDAISKVEQMADGEMSKLTGGLNLPGLF